MLQFKFIVKDTLVVHFKVKINSVNYVHTRTPLIVMKINLNLKLTFDV